MTCDQPPMMPPGDRHPMLNLDRIEQQFFADEGVRALPVLYGDLASSVARAATDNEHFKGVATNP